MMEYFELFKLGKERETDYNDPTFYTKLKSLLKRNNNNRHFLEKRDN